jgi:hypothetical protein
MDLAPLGWDVVRRGARGVAFVPWAIGPTL